VPSLKQFLAGVLTYVAGMLIDMGVDNYMARKIGSYESFIKEKKENIAKEAFEKATETVSVPPPPPKTEHTSGFTRDEAAEYTRNMAVEHLVASEDHLRAAAAGQDVKLCVSCLVEHHFPALRQYAREGKKFCRNKSECEAYDYLYRVVSEVERRLLEGDTNLIELAEKLRSARKLLSPSMQVLRQLEEKLKELEKLGEEEENEKEGGVATSPPVVFHESPSCIPEVKEKIVRVAPRVAKVLSERGFTLKPIRLDIKEGTVVKDGLESCAATDPDSNPIRQLYNCACWGEMDEREKEKIVAHELAHAFGVRDEEEAEKVAEEALK